MVAVVRILIVLVMTLGVLLERTALEALLNALARTAGVLAVAQPLQRLRPQRQQLQLHLEYVALQAGSRAMMPLIAL